MKIYLASSWRNSHQELVLVQLLAAGFEVYDFKNPPNGTGFGWAQVGWHGYDKHVDRVLDRVLDADLMRDLLSNPIAEMGFKSDFDAMKWADACVLLLPCGRSAHLEAGWFAGAGKLVVVLAPQIDEPELMYKCFDDSFGDTPIYENIEDVTQHLVYHESKI